MAKVSSHFQCMICKQRLNFPNNVEIVDFIILVLNFYKIHGLCESLEPKPETTKLVVNEEG